MPLTLYLSTATAFDTNYCTEDGQIIYKVDSPFKLVGRRATIDKIVPNVDSSSDDMRDRFTRIGEIEFSAITPTKITWQGETKEVGNFFRKGERKWDSIGSDRIFTGTDGVEYRWVVGNKMTTPALYLNTNSEVLVAKLRRKHLGVAHGAPRPALLEISELGDHMVDIIIITLAFIEKMRKDRD
ncbi:hypothetical protein BKA70DRAFT_1401298 [Coprinopsis sp. MPI-PUGE-AT-0042]|nr:hypothetical protein BKA70DRAFT_1401298 [Coprinopsis sp. MPI-PUGE-AT-0042]